MTDRGRGRRVSFTLTEWDEAAIDAALDAGMIPRGRRGEEAHALLAVLLHDLAYGRDDFGEAWADRIVARRAVGIDVSRTIHQRYRRRVGRRKRGDHGLRVIDGGAAT